VKAGGLLFWRIVDVREHFYLNVDGQLQPMHEEFFSSEDRLQELVANHPSLLGGDQITPEDHRRFILVGREQGIADVVGGSNRWALDHLFIDQDAVPTLVEAKRSTNSEIRRSVVGQMMDYAAHATQSWNVSEIRRAFEERSPDPEGDLAQLLQAEPDADKFWDDVEINLRAARMRLLFVADGIPDELARVVEFMNQQMAGIEVLAVEIKQFRGAAGSTLVPRVIGRTAAALDSPERRSPTSPRRRRLTKEEFLAQILDPAASRAAQRLLDVTEHAGGIVRYGDTSVSLRCKSPAWRLPLSVAWLSPVSDRLSSYSSGSFIFGMTRWDLNDQPPQLVNVLENWVSSFEGDPLFVEGDYKDYSQFAISHRDAAANIDLLCERLGRVFRELSELNPEQG